MKKENNMRKQLATLFLVICIMVLMQPRCVKASGNYTADWQRWSQGASAYSAMQYGCRVTAYSKMLAEAGYAGFGNPDGFFEWGKARGYFRESDTLELKGIGTAPVTYINSNGGTASLVGQKALTGNNATDAVTVMNLINQGYYVVLTCSAHSVYVGRAESISQGTAVILDSWASTKIGPSFQYRNYTQYTFKTANYFRITDNSTSLNVTFDSESVDNLTDTNATISIWVSNAGSITERGFYIGMSNGYQNKVIVGTEQVEWTRFREIYNIADYYGDLTPGITYTYFFYVKKGEQEYHSAVGHFQTTGSTNVTFDTYGVDNISEDSAHISTWFSNPNGYTISSIGFCVGESFRSLKKVEVYRNVGWTRAEPKCGIKDYAGSLKESTNYVARFYVTIGTVTYYSDYIVFSTASSIKNMEKEHVWNAGEITDEVTCTEDGTIIYTCTVCGKTKIESIEATGHIRDCVTNNDGTHSWICSNCGEAEMFNCHYEVSVVKPTCNTEGYTIYTCVDCAYTYKADDIECVEHSFTNYVSDNNATSETDGTKTAYCDYGCGMTNTIVDKGSILKKVTSDLEKSENNTANIPIVKVKSFKVKPGKGKLILSWKKLSGITGYEIQVSTKKNLKKAKTITVSKSKKKYVKKGLESKKKYYIRIRAYKNYQDINGKIQRSYGKWNKTNEKTK